MTAPAGSARRRLGRLGAAGGTRSCGGTGPDPLPAWSAGHHARRRNAFEGGAGATASGMNGRSGGRMRGVNSAAAVRSATLNASPTRWSPPSSSASSAVHGRRGPRGAAARRCRRPPRSPLGPTGAPRRRCVRSTPRAQRARRRGTAPRPRRRGRPAGGASRSASSCGPQLLVEEVLELQRARPLGGVGRVQRGLRRVLLERGDDGGGVADRAAVELEHRQPALLAARLVHRAGAVEPRHRRAQLVRNPLVVQRPARLLVVVRELDVPEDRGHVRGS